MCEKTRNEERAQGAGQLPNHGGTPPPVDLTDPVYEALLSMQNASENVSNRDSRRVLITHADHHPC